MPEHVERRGAPAVTQGTTNHQESYGHVEHHVKRAFHPGGKSQQLKVLLQVAVLYKMHDHALAIDDRK